MKRCYSVALALGFVMVPSVGTQEKFTLKFKEPGEGEGYSAKTNDSTTIETKITDGQGNVVESTKEVQGNLAAYTRTVLKKKPGEKQPTAEKHVYAKAQAIKDGKATPHSYDGKTLLIEKKEGKYQFSIEGGGDLTAEELSELDKDYNTKSGISGAVEKLLPKQPVKVSESWTVDAKLLEPGWDEEVTIDWAKAKVTGKLLRVYPQGKQQFGVIEFVLELPVKGLKNDNKDVVFKKGKYTAKAVYDGCIDGTSSTASMRMTMDFDMQMSVQANGMQFSANVVGSGKFEGDRQDLAKK